MQIEVVQEDTPDIALFGMSLSYYPQGSDIHQWYQKVNAEKQMKTALALVRKGPDHAKFLRAINLKIVITAPRYWWSEMDTYKVGTVGLSASTMHTLTKRELTEDDFEYYVPTSYLNYINQCIMDGRSIDYIKSLLPEGYKQTRLWCTNYQVLRTIYHQRETHRLEQWQKFLEEILQKVQNPSFILE